MRSELDAARAELEAASHAATHEAAVGGGELGWQEHGRGGPFKINEFYLFFNTFVFRATRIRLQAKSSGFKY